jgi:hypothetical protein
VPTSLPSPAGHPPQRPLGRRSRHGLHAPRHGQSVALGGYERVRKIICTCSETPGPAPPPIAYMNMPPHHLPAPHPKVLPLHLLPRNSVSPPGPPDLGATWSHTWRSEVGAEAQGFCKLQHHWPGNPQL